MGYLILSILPSVLGVVATYFDTRFCLIYLLLASLSSQLDAAFSTKPGKLNQLRLLVSMPIYSHK